MAKKVPIRPLGDRILVQEIESEDQERTTEAGIIIPDTVKKDKGAKHGEVVAVGPGKRDEDGEYMSVEVKVGDEVLFNWGDEVQIGEETYHIVNESSILGVVEG